MIAPVETPAATNGVPTERDRVNELKGTVSASRLNLWQQCRLKFYFRYVLKIRRSQSGAQYVGSMVHLILQAWNMARWKRALIETAVLKRHFEDQWAARQQESKVYWDNEEQEESKKEAWSLLDLYFRETPIRYDETPEGVEVSIEADLKRYGLPRLIGILDLIRQGGRIVDFKTAAQTPNPERAAHLNETQLSCYSVLYRDNTGTKETGLELHQLVKLKTPKLVVTSLPPMTQAQETRLFRIMGSYMEGLERGDFVPSPNPMSCACCEYFNECRNWR